MASTNVSLDDIDLSSLRVSYVLISTSTEWKYLKKKQKARRIYIYVYKMVKMGLKQNG